MSIIKSQFRKIEVTWYILGILIYGLEDYTDIKKAKVSNSYLVRSINEVVSQAYQEVPAKLNLWRALTSSFNLKQYRRWFPQIYYLFAMNLMCVHNSSSFSL